MSSPLLTEMGEDLRRSGGNRVLYLEGKTDVPVLFGFLGQPLPAPPQPQCHL